MAGRKKKAPGKVVDYTGKHKLEAAGILGRKDIKQLDPMLVDSILSPLYDTVKRGKKRKLGGFNVTNRFSKRMLPNKKRTTRIT